MIERVVPSTWLDKEGRRLDCGPYLSGAIEAKLALESLSGPKNQLSDVTAGGSDGIFHAGREGRNWVEDRRYGIPFLNSSDILNADLSRLALLSAKQVARNPKFKLRKNWTLITRSGTIGRMVFCRPQMEGLACSEDVLRVSPDQTKIPAGFLYAFLSGRYGIPLIVGGTYGAIIQHIEPQHIEGMPIPRFGERLEGEVDQLVKNAASLRERADAGLREAQNQLRDALGTAPLPRGGSRLSQRISSRDLSASSRFDAFYHNATARVVEEWVCRNSGGATDLEDMASVFDVPPFKHIYVSKSYGVPFYTSADIFLLDREPDKFLSRTRTKNLHKYILSKGWVLLARSGQLGGIIGTPQFADSTLDGAAASDHVIRIVPKRPGTAGFLFTYLSLPEVGYQLMLRTACGTSIPALWPVYLNRMRVPLVPSQLIDNVEQLVTTAFEDRVVATSQEHEARQIVEQAIDTFPRNASDSNRTKDNVGEQ